MTTELIVTDLQSLTSGASGLIELFELSINDTDTIYFTNYQESSGALLEGSPGVPNTNLVQFRDFDTPNTINTYFPIPTQLTGIEHRTQGQLPQPKLTIANVLKIDASNSLAGLLNGVSYNDLLGQKFVRRRTLQKYLYGEAGDSNPPVEWVRDVYYLDRIENENMMQVTFVLVSPADLTNVQLPRRNVIGNACSWRYQGAGQDLATKDKVGGCTWPTDSEIDWVGTTPVTIYMNSDDEYIYSDSLSFATWAGGPASLEGLVSTSETLTRVEEDGSLLTGQTGTNYWQSAEDNNTTAPGDDLTEWMRVRVYTTYAASLTINVYTDSRYNTVVLDNGVLWRAISKSQASNAHVASPGSGSFWERADSCGKRLGSCSRRFAANPVWYLHYDGQIGNFTVGRTVRGGRTGSTAVIIEDNDAGGSGNLTVVSATGPFVDNEELREIDADGNFLTGRATTNDNGSVSGLYALEPTGKISTVLRNNARLPYGGFPTARVF